MYQENIFEQIKMYCVLIIIALLLYIIKLEKDHDRECVLIDRQNNEEMQGILKRCKKYHLQEIKKMKKEYMTRGVPENFHQRSGYVGHQPTQVFPKERPTQQPPQQPTHQPPQQPKIYKY